MACTHYHNLKSLFLVCLFSASCSSIQMIDGPRFTELLKKNDSQTEEALIEAEEAGVSLADENIEEEELLAEEGTSEDEAIEVPEEPTNRRVFNPFAFLQGKSSTNATEAPVEEEVFGPALALDYHQEHFEFWKKYFTGRGRERFERQLARGEEYRELVQQVMADHGLPAELFYVGLIESGYALQAASHAQAVGPWQFIKGTAKRYGMRVIPGLDERTNIHKATKAAARYYQDLYNIFGSWELALAAYNAGEYRIINAIRKGHTRDFKELVEKKLLPRETIYYVPKVAAARYLSNNRERYKFSVPRVKDQFYTAADEVRIQGRFSLQDVSRQLNIDLETLKRLNPDIRYQVIQAPRLGHRLIVPNSKVELAANLKLESRQVAEASASTTGTYHVRRGDNLSKIAEAHGTNVHELKRLNGLRGSRILVGQTLRVPSSMGTYTVRRGDNLTKIARAHGTTVASLRGLNTLRGNRIYPGQALRVPSSERVVKTYTVRRGDNLSRIARQFNTTVSALMELNSLKGARIYPNQRLVVPSGES